MTIGRDLSLKFEPLAFESDFCAQPALSDPDNHFCEVLVLTRSRILSELNQTARNPVQPSDQAANYTQQTSAMRSVTRRNSPSRERDPDGPFLEGSARRMRTTFLAPQRPLPLSCSSGSPLALGNPRGDCIPASSTLDARVNTLQEQQKVVLRSLTVIRKHLHSGKHSRALLQRVGPQIAPNR